MFTTVPPRSEGRIAIVTDAGWDAVDVSELQRAIRAPANNSDADGQAVWSWHPDADAKLATTLSRHAGDGGQKARRTGESAE